MIERAIPLDCDNAIVAAPERHELFTLRLYGERGNAKLDDGGYAEP